VGSKRLTFLKFTRVSVKSEVNRNFTKLHSTRLASILCMPGKWHYDRKQSGYDGQTKPIFQKKG
jgi:ribosomal protein L44E